MHCFCILFLKRLFSCGLMLVLMNIEELYTHVSACRELYGQGILCSVIYSMLHTIECCLAGGKFKEYSKTICELKVIKVKWWPVIFVHFQGVPLMWARDEWCSCKDVWVSAMQILTVTTLSLLSTSVFDNCQRKDASLEFQIKCYLLEGVFQYFYGFLLILHCGILSSCLWIRSLNPQKYEISCAHIHLR